MTNILLAVLVIIVIGVGTIALVFTNRVLAEFDSIKILLTVLANKQGATQDDIKAAISPKSEKSDKLKKEKEKE